MWLDALFRGMLQWYFTSLYSYAKENSNTICKIS